MPGSSAVITDAPAVEAPATGRPRRWATPALLVGCVVLACTLPAATVLTGAVVLAGGIAVRALVAQVRTRGRGWQRGQL